MSSIDEYAHIHLSVDFLYISDDKEFTCNAGDLGLILGSGRSPGEGNGNPLQYCHLRITLTEGPVGLQSMGSQRVSHDSVTNTYTRI